MDLVQSREGYENDPAHIVAAELARQSKGPDSESSRVAKEQLEQLQHLRSEAWEWTNVDGKRTRGCELLHEHAKKLVQEVTGVQANSAGPPDAALTEAVRRRKKAKSEGMEVAIWQQFESVRHRVDGLEKKVDEALQHTKRTNAILDALAKQQGIDVEVFDRNQGVETDSTVDDNDSASERLSRSSRSPVPAPLPPRIDRRAAKQNVDTRPSPIRRKAEAEGITFSSPRP